VPRLDLTVELITHRFTPGSRDVLPSWYPRTKLEMDPEQRTVKRNKFGGQKHVFTKPVMAELRAAFDAGLAAHRPQARVPLLDLTARQVGRWPRSGPRSRMRRSSGSTRRSLSRLAASLLRMTSRRLATGVGVPP